MADISGIIQTIGAVVVSGVFTTWVARNGNKSARKTAEAEAQLKGQGQIISGEAKFRQDQSLRISALEKRLDEMSVRLDESNNAREQQGIDAARVREVDRMRFEATLATERDRFDAREDQLMTWGTWNADPLPRQPPTFVWHPHP